MVVGGFYGEDVPGVGGDYVGGEEVDLIWTVGDAVGVEVAFVGTAAMEDGAFDLDAGEVAGVFEGEVEGGHVSPRLGDDEAEFGGADHETQLRPLAARLGVADVHTWNFQRIALQNGYWDNKKRGPGEPRSFLCLYFYFINLAGGNRQKIGKYIWIRKMKLGGIGGFGGLDKNSNNCLGSRSCLSPLRGLVNMFGGYPTACALGCVLSPLRGCFHA